MSVREKIRKRIRHLHEIGVNAKKVDDQALMLDAMIRIEECKHLLNTI
jgi:hypothetical protein